MVVADNLAGVVNQVFATHETLNGGELLVGEIFFAFQIYGDFSGYSDIALGTSRLFGFELRVNFRYPYFSRDIAEFWRRWHISLSSWFRDYLYIPLGGSRGTLAATVRNVVITFVVSGLWHGANWTFVVWGAINGLLFLPLLIAGRNRHHVGEVSQDRWMPSLSDAFGIARTFTFVCIAWVFFRAASLSDALAYLQGIATRPWQTDLIPYASRFTLIAFLVTTEWLGRNRTFPFSERVLGRWVDAAIVSALVWAIVVWGSSDQLEFIYFQF